jgi:hypothetical protein
MLLQVMPLMEAAHTLSPYPRPFRRLQTAARLPDRQSGHRAVPRRSIRTFSQASRRCPLRHEEARSCSADGASQCIGVTRSFTAIERANGVEVRSRAVSAAAQFVSPCFTASTLAMLVPLPLRGG